MPDPTSFLQWLHQTYTGQWKGTVHITTVPGEDHGPGHSHWQSTITATGGVVRRDDKNHTLQDVTGSGDARSKKGAESAAAEQVYRQLVAEGWWDPNAPPKPKKATGVSRATRYITDSTPCNEHNPLAYLDVSIDRQPVGRVVLELFRYKKGNTKELHAPMAVENFLAFCHGVEVGGRQLSYVGVPFTRVVKRFVVQAGDVVNKDGTGGAHIHSSFGEAFPDEGLEDKNYRHTFPFMLSCANLGLEDTNSSQFFITVAPCASLDGHHTCFGKVLRGYSTVKEIEHVYMLYTPEGLMDRMPEEPSVPITITAAGELPAGTVLTEDNAPVFSGGGYPMWAEDQGPPPASVSEVSFRLDISSHLKQLGNEAYKQGEYRSALRHYRQAYHYLSWTTFKHRTPDGDCDTNFDEQAAIWHAEGVLLGNMVAAQIKLGQFAAAVQETCPDLIRKAPDNPKTYLRAAQARIGLGPGEYDDAASLLNQALAKAKEQDTPTKHIIAELHRVRTLRKAHTSKLRAAFAAAFNSGLLHHPADDTPHAPTHSSPSSSSPSPAAAAAAAAGGGGPYSGYGTTAAGRTWRGMPVRGGPVGPDHVIEDTSQPVVVEDAWGTHLLVADDGNGYGGCGEEAEGGGGGGGWQQQRLTDLLLRQARLKPEEGGRGGGRGMGRQGVGVGVRVMDGVMLMRKRRLGGGGGRKTARGAVRQKSSRGRGRCGAPGVIGHLWVTAQLLLSSSSSSSTPMGTSGSRRQQQQKQQ